MAAGGIRERLGLRPIIDVCGPETAMHWTGYELLLIAAALAAAIFPIVAALALSGTIVFGTTYGPFLWHGHEMLYGFVGAAMGRLTLASVSDSKKPELPSGMQISALVVLWLVARVAVAASSHIGPAVLAVLDSAFLVSLSVVVCAQVTRANCRHLAHRCLLLSIFSLGNVVWHLPAPRSPLFGTFISVSAVLILLVLVCGRPTGNILPHKAAASAQFNDARAHGLIDSLAILSVILALCTTGLLIVGDWESERETAGAAYLLAAFLNAWRLFVPGARGASTHRKLIFRVAYAWLVTSIFLLGLSYLAPSIVTNQLAFHAVLAGGAGVAIAGIMASAILDQYGGDRAVCAAFSLVYALVNLGALLRVGIIALPIEYAILVGSSAVMWSGAFALLLVIWVWRMTRIGQQRPQVGG